MPRSLKTPDMIPVLVRYFRQHPAGGIFHHALSNDPTDRHIAWLLEGHPQEDEWGHALALAMVTMTRTQRSKAISEAFFHDKADC